MKLVKNDIMDFINGTKDADCFTLDDKELFAEHINTDVYVLNGVLSGDMVDGGLECGRTTELAGESRSGKTALANYFMEKFLTKFPEYGTIRLYETEGRVSESLSNLISPKFRGRVIVKQIATVDELSNDLSGVIKPKLEEFKKAGKPIKLMIVLDSLGNLGTDKEIKDAEEQDNKGDMGRRAKMVKALFRTITVPILSKFQIPFICVNHTYAVIGAYVPTNKAGGGSGVEYLSNTILEVKKVKDDDLKEQNKATAIQLRVLKSLTLEEKTKVVIHFKNGRFLKYSNILTLAKEHGVVQDRNAGSKGKVYTFKGIDYTKKDLAQNVDILEEIVKELNVEWRKKHSFMVDMGVDTSVDGVTESPEDISEISSDTPVSTEEAQEIIKDAEQHIEEHKKKKVKEKSDGKTAKKVRGRGRPRKI